MFDAPEIVYVFYFKAPYGMNPPPRRVPADRQEVEIITAGRGFYKYMDRTVEAVPGTMIWHYPGEETIYMNDYENPYECIVLSFGDNGDRALHGMCRWMDRISFQVFIDNVLNEYHSEFRDMAKLSYYAYGQLHWQFKSGTREHPEESKRYKDIRRIVDWIDNHYRQDINLGMLAEMGEMSIPHLHTLFRELVNQTPYQYLQSRRILAARKLLATTRLPVREVCEKAGFYDLGNFCRMFRKVHGITAQEYRRLYTDKR